MSESVDILVAAENKASPVFNRVGEDAERLGMRVKESGQKVKASTELVGTFANVLGNTQFGGIAGQLAGLTERVSAFSEVSKAGAAGALAFKAGLVAAAGVVTYKTTEIIASWWMEIDKTKASAEEAAKSFAKMEQALDGTRKKKFGENREDLSLVFDSGDRKNATIEAAANLERQAKEMEKQGGVLDKERKELEKLEQKARDAWKIPGVVQQEDKDVKNKKEQIAASEQLQKSFYDEAKALRELVGKRAESIQATKAENEAKLRSNAYIDNLKEELALLEAGIDARQKQAAMERSQAIEGTQDGIARAEQRRLLAERNAPKRSNEAAGLLEQVDALKEEQAERKRIEAAQDRELSKLELKRIEITRGKEAAKAYALQMEGLSEEFARNTVAREAELDALANAGKVDKGPQQAVQGRLLTQGNTSDPVVELLKKLVAATEKNTQDVSKALRESAKDEPWTVKTVTVP